MSSVIVRILALLKSGLGVNEVYALQDRRNVKCKALLSNVYFEECDADRLLNTVTGDHGVKMRCNLAEINFGESSIITYVSSTYGIIVGV